MVDARVDSTGDASSQVADVIRVEGARILATLVRSVGSWSIAEDAVQEATLAALHDWPRRGVPDSPRAWLTTTARHKAVDLLRREAARRGKEQAGEQLMELHNGAEPADSVVTDDLLRLIFTCCHPSLAPDAQLALALRTLCQLSVAQVAAALLTSEAAMQKRLTRTRQKIAAAKIPYRVPDDTELPARLAVVCSVVHALYTAGHAPLSGAAVVDVDLCTEGLRLARLLVELLPGEPLPAAVLALVLLTEARRPARTAADGSVVLLTEQDRTRWDQRMITEGSSRLADSLRRTQGIADPLQLQAAIALEHDRAPRYADTDWAELLRLYDLLVSVAPSPPACLARAVVLSELTGPDAGLAALSALAPDPRSEAVRSELLARQGHFGEAVAAAERSLAGQLSDPERHHRQARRDEWARLARTERPA